MNFQFSTRALPALVFLMILFLTPLQPNSASSTRLPQTPLSIHTSSGVVTFTVELAATDEDRKRGLMFRINMQDDEGMLFDYHVSRQVSMWMKDTLIPLDMLFISGTGEIIKIAANTEPHSLAAISSGKPVRAVLELKGGATEAFGIRPGDRVSHAIFNSKGSGE